MSFYSIHDFAFHNTTSQYGGHYKQSGGVLKKLYYKGPFDGATNLSPIDIDIDLLLTFQELFDQIFQEYSRLYDAQLAGKNKPIVNIKLLKNDLCMVRKNGDGITIIGSIQELTNYNNIMIRSCASIDPGKIVQPAVVQPVVVQPAVVQPPVIQRMTVPSMATNSMATNSMDTSSIVAKKSLISRQPNLKPAVIPESVEGWASMVDQSFAPITNRTSVAAAVPQTVVSMSSINSVSESDTSAGTRRKREDSGEKKDEKKDKKDDKK